MNESTHLVKAIFSDKSSVEILFDAIKARGIYTMLGLRKTVGS